MRQFKRVMTATATLLLVAGCGGGGGDSGDAAGGVGGGSATASPLKITTTNAPAAAANALANVDNPAPTTALDAAMAVKAGHGGHGGSAALQVLRTALTLPRPTASAGVQPKVAVNEVLTCEQGGTVRVSGEISSGDALVAGDNFTLVATACRTVVDGTSSTVDGTLSFNVQSGSAGSTFPAQAEFSLRATDLRVVTSTATVTATGDLQASWTASSATRQQYAFTGTEFGTTLVQSGVTRSVKWRNYRHVLAIDGSQSTITMQATIETQDSSLGGDSLLSYELSTPTPVVHSGGSTTGELRVVGSQSVMLVRLSAPDVATLLVDGNGDGVFEQTLTRRLVDLRAL